MNPQTKKYVLAFRLNELKAVLERLWLPQSGRKAELQSRIQDYFGEPHNNGYTTNIPETTDPVRILAAERIIEEVYCNWKALPTPQRQTRAAELQPAATPPQQHGAAAAEPSSLPIPAQLSFQNRVEIIPAGGSQSSGGRSPLVNGKLLSAAARPAKSDRRVSCLCEHSRDAGVLVQCQCCGVWQHTDCVGKGEEAARAAAHYCELCRAAWVDPFWEVKNSRVIPPTKLLVTGGPVARGTGGLNEPQRAADSTFQLSSSQIHLIQKGGGYQLQAAPLLLDDPVAFRFQWPRNSDLKTNSVPYRVYSRQPTAKVGPNVRDEPANLSSTSFVGRNKIRLQANDSREFVLVVQLVKRRELEDVKRLMAPPESVAAALKRVKKQTGGGEDDDLSIGSTVVSLRDPLSGTRIVKPARFLGTDALVSFDLDTFLNMAKRSRKWQCPHSMRHSRVQDLQADTFMTHILSRLTDYQDVMEVEVSPEGEWRPAGGRYAWMQVTEQPITGQLPLAHKSEVKEERGAVEGRNLGTVAVNGANDDESEEELSEAEELRQAAVQYAKSARPVVQDVIVLDDSDDERPPPAKRVVNGVQPNGFHAVDRYPRQRTLHQPTIHSSLAAARSLNGAGPSKQQASSLSAFKQTPTVSTSTSGLSNANSTGARVSNGWTGASNIRISLPNRTNQTSRLVSSSQAGPSSSAGPQAHGAAQGAFGIPSSRAPEPPSSPHGHSTYNAASPSHTGYQQQQQGGMMGTPPIDHPWSYAPHRPLSQGPGLPLGSNGWHQYVAPFSPVYGQQGSNAAARRTPSSFHLGQTMRPTVPSSPHRPPPAVVLPPSGGSERLADSWATGQGLSPAERDMLGSLLQDDAVSPQTRTDIAAAVTSPSNQLAGQDDNTVIDLDSD